MWFGTDAGLCRWDGYRFKTFNRYTTGLWGDRPRIMLRDGRGRFWIFYTDQPAEYGTVWDVKGWDVFDPATERMAPRSEWLPGHLSVLPTDLIQGAALSSGDIVLLTRDRRLLRYHTDEGTWSEHTGLPEYVRPTNCIEVRPDVIAFVSRTRPGEPHQFIQLHAGKGQQISAVRPEGRFRFVRHLEGVHGEGMCYLGLMQTEDTFRLYRHLPDGTLQIDTVLGAYFQRRFAGKNSDQYAPELPLSPMVFHHGMYWLFTSVQYTTVTSDGEQASYLHERIPDLRYTQHQYMDHQGRMWVSTEFGIYIIKARNTRFSTSLTKTTDNDAYNPVRGIGQDATGRVWVASDGREQAWWLQVERGRITSSKAIGNRLGSLPTFTTMWHEPDTTTIVQVKANGSELQSYDDRIGRSRLLRQYDELQRNTSYYRAENGSLWYGTDDGRVYERRTDGSERVLKLSEASGHLYIYQFVPRPGGLLWCITDAGIFEIESSTLQVSSHYHAQAEPPYRLPADRILYLHQDQDEVGTYWLGTARGLLRWRPAEGTQRLYTRSDGLSSDFISAVYGDGLGHLWLASEYGIMRFRKADGHVDTWLEEDGISHNEFNRMSHAQLEDGTILFGGLRGVTAFYPPDFTTDTTESIAPLVLTGYLAYSDTARAVIDQLARLRSEGRIELQHNAPPVRVSFSLLDYTDTRRQLYAYRLRGLDDTWLYQSEPYVRLARLPYGDYTLEVRGQTADGRWSADVLRLPVSVSRPLYLRPWFLLSMATLLVGVAGLILVLRNRRLRRQQILLENQVAERTATVRQQADALSRQTDELRKLEAVKSRFFANISHELRTPLTLILGPLHRVSRILTHSTENLESVGLLDTATRNARHLLRLVNEILDLSKLEQGRMTLDPVLVEVHHLLHQIAQGFSEAAKQRGVRLVVDLNTSSELTLLLDAPKLSHIINNLLGNALRFTSAGDEVCLQLEWVEGHLSVTVGDTGSGVHPDDLPHIFDRYYQSQHSGSRGGAAGIGLAYCRELAGLMGGNIQVESAWKEGTTFIVSVPAPAATGVPTVIPDSPSIPVASSDALDVASSIPTADAEAATLLIVEDNPDLRDYLAQVLSGYHVLTAPNGQVALEVLERARTTDRPVQLVLSDLMMPVLDGLELLETVKANDHFRGMPFVMLTARAGVRSKLKALRIGVDDYLLKPFEEEELQLRISRLLERVPMRKITTVSDEEEAELVRHSQPQMDWLAEMEAYALDHVSDTTLTLTRMAQDNHISERQLQRRLKQLTGLSGGQYLREVRLQHARDLLLSGTYITVKEVAAAVGFRDAAYFSRAYRKRFGVLPSGEK